jgi:hypothetical protein
MTTDEEESPSPGRHGWELVVDKENLNIVFALCPIHAGGLDEFPRGGGERSRGPINLTPWRASH